jgi:hypothetical protein
VTFIYYFILIIGEEDNYGVKSKIICCFGSGRKTMKNFVALGRAGIILFFSIIVASVMVTPVASQTAISKVVITSVNANETFPDVRAQARALDANGAFIPNLATTQFTVQEDGEPVQIQEVSTAALPLSGNVVFVIDELALGTRLAVVRDSILSFAQNHMLAGDQVEVLAASNGGKTQTIVPLTSDPEVVVKGMQEENYNPNSAKGTLLLNTINQGLTDLSTLNENIDGVSRVITFSVSINDQLNLGKTIEQAIQLRIPIHTVLLGSQDIKGALGRLARETQAGPGTISPEELNSLFATLDAQRVQDQYLISYRSRADQPGEHKLLVVAGGVSSSGFSFALDRLESPLVHITVPTADTVITRTEAFFRQDPKTTQPTEQTVAVEINWPDGHPREIVLKNTALIVKGKSLGPATVIRENGKDPVVLEFTWDLSTENTPGESLASIVVEAEDELGLKGKSEPLPVTVAYVLFAGTEGCPAFIAEYTPALCANSDLILPLASLIVAVAALLVVLVYLRRNPKVQKRVTQRLGTMMTRMGGTRVGGTRTNGNPGATRMVEPLEAAKAILVVLEGNSGTKQTEFRINKTTTLGRSGDHADMVFQADQKDRSPISRLHCTLVETDGSFGLKDQGSSNGTFINGVRLKPDQLNALSDGDIVELARVQDGGIKLKFQLGSRSGHLGTRLVGPEKRDPDELPPSDGYTPTKLM